MGDETSKKRDGVQGVAAVVGITLGVIPLLQMVFSGRPGLLKFVLGNDPGVIGYVVPAAILLIAVAAVAVTEAKK